MMGHSYGSWRTTKEPTEETTGLKERECSVCHHKETETLPKLEHTHKYSTEWTIDKEATCTETGSKSHHCLGCDEKIDVTEIENLEHEYEDYICKNCQYHYFTSSLKFSLNSDEKSYSIISIEEEDIDTLVIPATYLNLPVTVIGKYAFYNCNSLTSVIIPSSITKIEEYAFGNSNKSSFHVYYEGAMENWCSISFVNDASNPMNVKSYSDFYLKSSINNKWEKVKSIEIPNTITVVGDNQFYGFNNVTSITLPDSVTSIGKYAFEKCSSLTGVVIPESVTSIGNGAFRACYNLPSITISNSVTSIGRGAFSGCYSLSGVYYEGTIEDWCNIKLNNEYSNPMYYARHFYIRNSNNEWEEVTSIKIPNIITEIGDFQFYGFNNIEAIVIPNSILNVGLAAFYNCDNIIKATIPSVAASSIKSKKLEEVIVTSGESIGDYAFSGCSSLTSIVIPNSVTSIGDNAFMGCSKLTNITMPDSITSIGELAFRDCISLTSIVIPNGVTRIECQTFYGCSNLKNIIIPNNITNIDDMVFYKCDNLQYNEYDNGLYLGNEENPYLVLIKAKDTTITSCEIKNVAKIIYQSAFSGCNNITSIIVPSSVICIDKNSFSECNNLQYNEYGNGLYLGNEENPYLVLIKAKDTTITSCEIPSTTKFLYQSAFYRCSSLSDIYYGGNIEDWCDIKFGNYNSNPMSYSSGIHKNHFYVRNSNNEWEEVTSIEIPNKVTEIGYQFVGFGNVTSITIPDSVTNIGDRAFENCDSLESIIIPDGVISIEDFTFDGCRNLVSIIIPKGIISIGESAFNDCAFESITIPKSVKNIKSAAFLNNGTIKNVYYEGTIEDWCKIAFFGYYPDSNPMKYASHFYIRNSQNEWEEVISIEIPNTITEIGNCQFAGFTDTSIILPDSVTSVGSCAFYGCSNLESITIPDSVTSIGDYAFNYCSDLTNVYYEGTIENWCNIKFNNYSSNPMYYARHFYLKNSNNEWEEVTSIEIPSSISIIGKCQFSGFNNVTSITIPNSVTNIGNSAFSNCYRLVEIYNLSSLNITAGSFENGNIGLYAKAIHTSLTEESQFIEKDDFLFIKGNEDKYYLVKYIGKNENLILPIDIDGNYYEINAGAFYFYNNLTYLEVPNSVTNIGVDVFLGCNNIIKAVIPSFMISAISKTYIQEVIITMGTEIEDRAFSNSSSLTSIVIPNSVTSIGESAFSSCSALTNVFYEGTLEDWYNITFGNISSNPMYYASHFYLRNSNNEWEEVTSIEIPSSISIIGKCQFSGFNNVTSITIPNSVTRIEQSAFSNCSSLESITIPFVGASFNETENNRFGYIFGASSYNSNIPSSLKEVIITGGTSIGSAAFSSCSSLTSIVIPDSVTNIGNSAFSYCSSLTSITIPNSVTNIGNSAFYNCKSLTSIVIPNSVTSIGSAAFSGCSSLTNVYYEGTIEDWCTSSISGNNVFISAKSNHFYLRNSNSEWEEVTSVEIPNTITKIGANLFARFNNVTSITIPNSVTSIGDGAFNGCSSLTSIVIPDSVTSIEYSAFGACNSIIEVYYKGTLSEWNKISINDAFNYNLTNATRYYYSENKPTTTGNYWHYVDDVPTKWQ